MLLPPDLADPRSKAMIDAYVEIRQRHRAHRAWRMWLLVFGASIAALWLAQYEWIHPYASDVAGPMVALVRVALAVASARSIPLHAEHRQVV
jgi:hypothetical protein